MIRAARLVAVVIAIAGVVDPVVVSRVRAQLAVEIRTPSASHPQHPSASRQLSELIARLDGIAIVNGSEEPRAIVLLAGAPLPASKKIPVLALAESAEGSRVRIRELRVDSESIPGQTTTVTAVLDARGLVGRLSTVQMFYEDVRISERQHRWTTDAERAVLTFAAVATRPGIRRVRVVAKTPGSHDTFADTGVLVRDRIIRVLVYEPRPSWTVAFIRHALEEDSRFAVASVTRSSRTATTIAGHAPRSLSVADADDFDVVLVGAPDELRDSDRVALERFMEHRGGTVVLLPDRRLPQMHQQFDLPAFDEVLVDQPLSVQAGEVQLRASELLLMQRDSNAAFAILATVQHGGNKRAAVLSAYRGEGRLVVSGLLDAWRYRARDAGAFDRFWRGLVADLAIVTPARLMVRVDPLLARPGDQLRVRARWRSSELGLTGNGIAIPALRAELTPGSGTSEGFRLWPDIQPGAFVGAMIAGDSAQSAVSVHGRGVSADAMFRVEQDVVHPEADQSRAVAFTAMESGGAVADDVASLIAMLQRIDPGSYDQRIRPMRSGWWIVPFAIALCSEWAVRRRRGNR